MGIPRKCARYLAGKPLLWWTLETVQGLGRVVVVTDDDEIALLAQRKGVEVVRDPTAPSNQKSVDQAIWHAVRTLDTDAEIVATVQPTSPFLTRATILKCLQWGAQGSAITVVDDRHVRFEGAAEQAALVTPWETRQQLPPAWRLHGGCIATRTWDLQPHRRYGMPAALVAVEGAEAIDLDDPADWAAAEFYARQLSVAYRTDGGGVLGLGHVYRAATLLGHLVGDRATIYLEHPEGIALARQCGLQVAPASAFPTAGADVVIVENCPLPLGSRNGTTLVAIEDRSPWGRTADLLFNDLDGPPMDGPQTFQGAKYAVVRDEFLSVMPKPLAATVEEVVLTFGGTDPADLTRHALTALDLCARPLALTVILGPAYPPDRDLPLSAHHATRVVRAPPLLSPYLATADLAITSCGRTVYELVACQTPTVALPQNAHELRHASLSYDCGVWAVPMLGHQMQVASLAGMFQQAMDQSWRTLARARMATLDMKHGASRFWELVRAKHAEHQRAT